MSTSAGHKNHIHISVNQSQIQAITILSPASFWLFLFKIEIFYYNNEIFIQKVPMKILIEYIVLLQAQELFMQINQCPRYVDPSFS